MKIYVMRHGKTDKNHEGVFHGNTDSKLNDEGILQCNSAKEKVKNIAFDKIYVSKYSRTHQTARIVCGEECELTIDNRLNETDFGEFEGKNYKEIQVEYPNEYSQWQDDWVNFTPPKGESYKDVFSRVEKFMDNLLKEEKESDNILIVTHAGVMRAIYCYVMGKNKELFWKFGCDNADIAVLNYEYENLYLDSINHYK